jgi:SAM-dependent methyltransferase
LLTDSSAAAQESDIRDFWEHHPCGDQQVGGLSSASDRDYEHFFLEYDSFRYRREGHIAKCIQAINFTGKKVLEIGLGQGADSEQLIRRGARWSGLDITPESISRVRTRLRLHRLPFEDLKQGSALQIPYPDNYFDIVFSHGVLHHIPNIHKAQSEIARVLRPNGELILMVYAKWSFNYMFAISILRRLGLLMMYLLRVKPRGIYADHLANVAYSGIWNYLRMETFIHKNTDGPHNPYSKVYSKRELARTFAAFSLAKSYKRWMHGPPLPVSWMPLGKIMGWHLWAHLKPRKSSLAPYPSS